MSRVRIATTGQRWRRQLYLSSAKRHGYLPMTFSLETRVRLEPPTRSLSGKKRTIGMQHEKFYDGYYWIVVALRLFSSFFLFAASLQLCFL